MKKRGRDRHEEKLGSVLSKADFPDYADEYLGQKTIEDIILLANYLAPYSEALEVGLTLEEVVDAMMQNGIKDDLPFLSGMATTIERIRQANYMRRRSLKGAAEMVMRKTTNALFPPKVEENLILRSLLNIVSNELSTISFARRLKTYALPPIDILRGAKQTAVKEGNPTEEHELCLLAHWMNQNSSNVSQARVEGENTDKLLGQINQYKISNEASQISIESGITGVELTFFPRNREGDQAVLGVGLLGMRVHLNGRNEIFYFGISKLTGDVGLRTENSAVSMKPIFEHYGLGAQYEALKANILREILKNIKEGKIPVENKETRKVIEGMNEEIGTIHTEQIGVKEEVEVALEEDPKPSEERKAPSVVLKNINYRKCMQIFKELEVRTVRQRGSHMTLERDVDNKAERAIFVAKKGTEEVTIGILVQTLGNLKIPVETFKRMYFEL